MRRRSLIVAAVAAALALPVAAQQPVVLQWQAANLTEKQYEPVLHGEEGSRFVEVDARNRIVREEGLQERKPKAANSLNTNIDLDENGDPQQGVYDGLEAKKDGFAPITDQFDAAEAAEQAGG